MQETQCGARSWDSRITPWAEGSTTEPRRRPLPFVSVQFSGINQSCVLNIEMFCRLQLPYQGTSGHPTPGNKGHPPRSSQRPRVGSAPMPSSAEGFPCGYLLVFVITAGGRPREMTHPGSHNTLAPEPGFKPNHPIPKLGSLTQQTTLPPGLRHSGQFTRCLPGSPLSLTPLHCPRGWVWFRSSCGWKAHSRPP